MLVKVYGAAVQGIDATIVTIEVNSSRGIKFFARIDYGGFQLSFNVEEFYDFFYICYSIDIQVVNHSRFAGILPGKDESFKALFACTDGDG